MNASAIAKLCQQWHTLKMSLFRKYKRHYHVTRKAYFEAAESGSLGFTIGQKLGGPVTYQENFIDRDKTSRFAALIYNFLDEKNEIHYINILNLIRLDYPKVATIDELNAIEDGIAKIEKGVIPIKFNEREFTAKQIFELVSKSGYIEYDEDAAKTFKAINEVPFGSQLFWYQFKSFCFDAYRILSVLFDLIKAAENHADYKEQLKPVESHLKKCIYCLTETGSFISEEHIFPETLAGDQFYLPRGFVCDTCNNSISSQLDEALMNFDPIAFALVQFTPFTKAGKFPKANFQNFMIEKKDPNHIRFTAKDKTALPKNERFYDDGKFTFSLDIHGKKPKWKSYGRAIYKIALGFIAYDIGHEVALDKKYDPVRNFIIQGKSFPNNMIVKFISPHPYVRSFSDSRFSGTPYTIDIFGTLFFVNLEEFPTLQDHELAKADFVFSLK